MSAVIAAGLVLGAAGCGTAQKVRSAFGGKLPLQVRVAPDANEDAAVAVDLLVVYDHKLLDELLKMPASQWFAAKKQFVADHTGKIEVHDWEWVPGQPVPPQSIDYRAGADLIVVFADYQSAGDHRAVMDPQQPFRLVLAEREMTLEKIQ